MAREKIKREARGVTDREIMQLTGQGAPVEVAYYEISHQRTDAEAQQ